MNWAMLAVLVAILIAIGGGIANIIMKLSKKYFEIMEENQKQLSTQLRNVELSIQKFETVDKVQVKIDKVKEELHKEIEVSEERTEKKISDLASKIDRHIEKAS